jgi:ribulose-5-phosphate 4-epimerase/fuculose-1-phosphate aldolase
MKAEKYFGTRFKTIFIEKRKIENKNIKRLKFWGKIFGKLKLASKIEGGFSGNLSFRTERGFIITSAGSDLSNLKDFDFTEVVKADIKNKKVFVYGLKEPSSESFLHYKIYELKNIAKAIFHGHDDLILKCYKQLKIPPTKKEAPYGSISLANEAIKVLKIYPKVNYFILKNHGFVSLGKTIDQAGKIAIEYHKKALRMIKDDNNL